jgi:type I restriction enzyme, S subunit
MSKVVPDGWDVRSIGDICHTVYRYPTFYGMETFHKGVPVLRGELIRDNGSLSDDWASYSFVSDEFSQNYPRTILAEGDVVMAVRGTVGKFGKVGRSHINSQISPNLIRLAPDKSMVVPDYFYQCLFFIKNDLLKTNVSTTGVPAINGSDIKKAHCLIPPLPEQQKIASILTSVDEVIEKIQSQINKLQDLKKGTMNELLTRGIGHTEFKDSPIGRIPKGWEVVTISDVSKIGTGGQDTKDKKMGGKYPFFVRSQLVERIDTYSFDGEAILTAGDGVGTGKVFHYINGKFDFHQRVYKLSSFAKDIDPKFVFEYFRNNFIFQVNRFSAKGSVDSVRMEMIAKMWMPFPSLPEQQKIASILSSIDNHIEHKRHNLQQTQSLKKSLMQDLLTGKVRVTVH